MCKYGQCATYEFSKSTLEPILGKDLQNGFEQAKRDKEALEAQKKEIISLYEKEYKRLSERRGKYDVDILNAKSSLEELSHHRGQLQQQFDMAKSEITQQSKELLTVKRENARMKELYTTSSYSVSGPGIRRQAELAKEIMYKNMKLPYPANMLEVPMSPRYPIEPEKHFQDEVRRLRHLLDKIMDQIKEIQQGIEKELNLRNSLFTSILEELECTKHLRRQELDVELQSTRPDSAKSYSTPRISHVNSVTVYDLTPENRALCLERLLSDTRVKESLKDIIVLQDFERDESESKKRHEAETPKS